MPYVIDTATGHVDLVDRIIRFVCGYGTAGAVGYTGTGNGTLTLGGTYPSAGTHPATVTENWTITCTAGGPTGTFSVTGSVSGAQAAVTVGTAYDNGKVAFTIADGAVDFIVGDQFTFSTTQGAMKAAGQEWIYQGRASGQTQGGWMKGRGLAGTDSIYVGLQPYTDVPGDIYNVVTAGALGFNPSFAWNSQVGKSPDAYVASFNTSMPYWIVCNGQRFVVVSKVSTYYRAMYCGKILPYSTPSQYGYPVYIAGESNASVSRSDTNHGTRHFVDPGSTSSGIDSGCNFCFPDGSWQYFQNFYTASGSEAESSLGRSVWPYSGDSGSSMYVDSRLREMRDNIDGSYTLLPLILHSDTPSRQVFGELDGCYYVSGFNNAAENIVTVGGIDHLVVQNVFRTDRWSYWALKLA